jgi:predicted nucleic acid-binding protein
MTSRSFFDSNVLVYTDDRTAPDKRDRALELLAAARRSGTGVLSTQVLQEYFVSATRKLGVESALARRKVEIYSRFDLVPVNLDLILAAIDLHRLHGLSLWDSLIVQAARSAGCSILYTEDLQHGRRWGELTIVNPFREG